MCRNINFRGFNTLTSFTSTNVKLRLRFDVHLMFTWPPFDLPLTLTSPDGHLVFPDVHLTLIWPSPDHLTFMWPSLDPYLTLISSFQLKKSYMVVGGGWANPLQTLSQGLVLSLRFTFGPELNNFPIPAGASESQGNCACYFWFQCWAWLRLSANFSLSSRWPLTWTSGSRKTKILLTSPSHNHVCEAVMQERIFLVFFPHLKEN